jgi:acyl-CoA hydrolase
MSRPRAVTLRFLAEPSHVNFGGKVNGGAVMKWIDQAGYTCAASWTGGYCVTLYVGGLHFIRPIRVGDLVELRALVIHTGRTSLHIAIDIYARDPKLPDLMRTGHCVIVFVSLDENGRPQQVPAWTPVSDTDHALQAYALRLIELRKLMDAELESHLTFLERSTAAILP